MPLLLVALSCSASPLFLVWPDGQCASIASMECCSVDPAADAGPGPPTCNDQRGLAASCQRRESKPRKFGQTLIQTLRLNYFKIGSLGESRINY